MNKRFMQRLTLLASRIFAVSAVVTMLAWVVKYDMATNHEPTPLIISASVAMGLIFLSVATASVSEELEANIKSKKSSRRVTMQREELAIRENRLYMNINI